MIPMLDVARVAAGVNLLLLAALLVVWGRNYRTIRSKHTLGALIFATVLFAENAVALFYYLRPPPMSPPAVQAMMILQVLETVAIAFLVYVTYD